MKFKLLALAIAATFVYGGVAYAHHSFAATYLVDQQVTVKGKVVQFLYRNPHSFVKVEVMDNNNEAETYSLEWGGGAQLSGDHVTRDTLKPGDFIVVTGNPGRDPAEHRLRVDSITRPADGWKWVGVVR